MKKFLAILMCLFVMMSCVSFSASATTNENEAYEGVAVVNLDEMEVGEIRYYGDIVIQRASDDDQGPTESATRTTTEGFVVNSFAGNTSLTKSLNLNSTYRYFYIYVKNTGSSTISITIGNDSATQSENFYQYTKGSYYIWSSTKWSAQSHTVSFASINGMYGNAKAMLCSTLAEAEAHN